MAEGLQSFKAIIKSDEWKVKPVKISVKINACFEW